MEGNTEVQNKISVTIIKLIIQVINKRMVQFKKLTRNLFLTLHGHNVHHQRQQLSKFLMRYQQFASHTYCGAAGPVSKMAPRPRSKHEKRTAGSAWETWTVAAVDGVRCARVRWEINFLLTFETAPFFCVYPVYVSTTFFIYKATSFDPSVGHLQAYIADKVIGAVCTLRSQYVYINKIHKVW